MLECHACLTEWPMNGSNYDTVNRVRCTTPADAEYKHWIQPAVTVLDGEALCIPHLKNRWSDILWELHKEKIAYFDGQ